MLIPSIVVNKNGSPDWFCCGDPVPICTGWLEVMLDRKLMQDDNREAWGKVSRTIFSHLNLSNSLREDLMMSRYFQLYMYVHILKMWLK